MRLDVAVRVDLRAVGGDDRDGRGAFDGRLPPRRIFAETGNEPAMGRRFGLFSEVLPVRPTLAEGFEGAQELIGQAGLLA